jgi:hypothetical protein
MIINLIKFDGFHFLFVEVYLLPMVKDGNLQEEPVSQKMENKNSKAHFSFLLSTFSSGS